jgi:hypothetical protein
MRIVVALAVVVVFGAMMIFDTAALVRAAFYCATGGCGVSPMWLTAGAGVLAVAAIWSSRRSPVKAKAARVKKAGPPRSPRAKTAARKKPKPAK